MSRYSIEVLGFTDQEGHWSFDTADRTSGSIIVRPPVSVGEGFKRVILGSDRDRVDLEHVITTEDASVFLAESSAGGPEDRRGDIQIIADRIGKLANAPESAAKMMSENPFPL